MISIILKGHDYKYEISELVKLFTSEFEYVDEKHFGRVLENSILIHNNTLISKTQCLENYNVRFENIEHSDLLNLNEQEIKKVTKETIKRSMIVLLGI